MSRGDHAAECEQGIDHWPPVKVKKTHRGGKGRRKNVGSPSSATASPGSTGMQSVCTLLVEDARISDRDALLSALETLYDDQLEPLLLHVIRRVEEQTGKHWNTERVQTVARDTPRVSLVEKPGSNNRVWIHLDSRPDESAQACDEARYPRGIWTDLRNFVQSRAADWHEAPWPSSRYDLAKALRRELPAFQRLNLGQACYALELAVKVHHIFGYRDGRLVPFQSSVDCEKISRAENRSAIPDDGADFVTDWRDASGKMAILLREHPQGLPLSALKDRFRRRFGVSLSETALGHTKLSTLLTDPHLRHICSLELGVLGSERFLRPVRSPPSESSAESVRGESVDTSPEPHPTSESVTSWSPCSSADSWKPCVVRTFIELAPVDSGDARRRMRSEPGLRRFDSLHSLPCDSPDASATIAWSGCSLAYTIILSPAKEGPYIKF